MCVAGGGVPLDLPDDYLYIAIEIAPSLMKHYICRIMEDATKILPSLH